MEFLLQVLYILLPKEQSSHYRCNLNIMDSVPNTHIIYRDLESGNYRDLESGNYREKESVTPPHACACGPSVGGWRNIYNDVFSQVHALGKPCLSHLSHLCIVM